MLLSSQKVTKGDMITVFDTGETWKKKTFDYHVNEIVLAKMFCKIC